MGAVVAATCSVKSMVLTADDDRVVVAKDVVEDNVISGDVTSSDDTSGEEGIAGAICTRELPIRPTDATKVNDFGSGAGVVDGGISGNVSRINCGRTFPILLTVI